MNKAKKFVSVLLALVMALAMTTTAFATPGEGEGGSEGTPPMEGTDTTDTEKNLGTNNQFQPSTSTNTDVSCSITIENEETGHEYIAYQIFKGDLHVTEENGITSKTLSNIEWGDSINADAVASALASLVDGDVDASNAADVANWLSEKNSEVAAQFARAIDSCLTGNHKTLTGSNGKYVADNLAPGYYLIKDTNINNTDLEDDVYSANMLQVLGNETMKPKAEKPTLDKKITGIDEDTQKELDAVSAEIGKKVNFELTSKVPSMQGYTKYTYKITDTMTSGLDFDETSVVVKIGDSAIDSTQYSVEKNADGHGFTLNFTGLYELVGGSPDKANTKINAGTPITITYSATLNSNALQTNVETNTAKLTYSNNPNEDTETDTPDETVYVYDFTIEIEKVDANDTSKKLGGAEFVLKNAAGEFYYQDPTTKEVKWVNSLTDATTLITDTETGKATPGFQGLAEGTYYLEETKAPAGYNKLADPIKVVIAESEYDSNGVVTKYTITFGDGENAQTNTLDASREQTGDATVSAQLSATDTIGNNSGALLPETGGIGTTIFYIVGGVLAAGAVVLLITKRRMNIDKD